MKLFKCTNCRQPVYFENISCLQCHAPLGFVAETLQLIALTVENNGLYAYTEKSVKTLYKYCSNHQYNVCNWLIPADSSDNFCKACALNRVIPYLGRTDYVEKWRTIETAKHQLVYQLMRMHLPLQNKAVDMRNGLVFDFMSDDEMNSSDKKVMTGHDNGVITINIAEADDIQREVTRKQMAEAYRTVLGHFRHEIGHYYWERLIEHTSNLLPFRNVFGDERMDYGTALQRYYADGPPADWQQNYISTYATMHPWEDWAESWAHYMHIIDTLETAYSFGISVHPLIAESARLHAAIKSDPYTINDFDIIMQLWLPLTFAMTSLNRSMGMRDIYPFVITEQVKQKMTFIHNVVRKAAVSV